MVNKSLYQYQKQIISPEYLNSILHLIVACGIGRDCVVCNARTHDGKIFQVQVCPSVCVCDNVCVFVCVIMCV